MGISCIFASNEFIMLSRFILRIMGWKIVSRFTPEVYRSVVIMAPHTSNLDFVIGRLVFNAVGLPARFLIKREAFVFPIGIILRWLGGIPVDRSRRTNLVDQAASFFDGKEKMVLVITPEGTRSRTDRWKRGFYLIARKANVPIVPGYLDYAKKTAGLGQVVHPQDDLQENLLALEKLYEDKTGKHPQNFNLKAIRNTRF